MFPRVVCIVLDSVGIGELPDADLFGDTGAHTLGNIAKYIDGINLPNLKNLGLGNIESIKGVTRVDKPLANFGKMAEVSKGKDTTTGHWEIMGIHTNERFNTYPEGFPEELINQLESRINRKVIGNYPASGTQIIKDLGQRHLETGNIIVYTSSDSVLQIAAHEDVVPLKELYAICKVARELTLEDRFKVTRVIARPFVGAKDKFTRTANRRDFSVSPPAKTVLDYLKDANVEVTSIGKISDIFKGQGINHSIKTTSNSDGVKKLVDELNKESKGFIFVNLVDFDVEYGHRRDPVGYGHALQQFDSDLPLILDSLQEDDLLVITADHGNDPTHEGTDHTREYVPLLVYSKKLEGDNCLGIRGSFSDLGATIAHNFNVKRSSVGTSFLKELK